jgi:hypothetical protein
MALNTSHSLTANIPYAHLLPEYRPQLDASLHPEDGAKSLACGALSENLPQFGFGEFPHHPQMNTLNMLKGPTSRNPMCLNQLIVDARKLSGNLSIYAPVENETEICTNAVLLEVHR